MSKTLLAVVVVLAAVASSMSQTPEPLAAINKYIDNFNKGNAEGMAAMCADTTSILDGMAPHSWQGPTACADWYRDVLVEGKKHGASGYVVTLGKPRHLDVNGDRAYAVLPATMSFSLQGKQVIQNGATWTVALRKLNDGWRITAWAWSKGGQ